MASVLEIAVAPLVMERKPPVAIYLDESSSDLWKPKSAITRWPRLTR